MIKDANPSEKKLIKNPRLLLQYVVLNFFLIAMGLAAVVYMKKEWIQQNSVEQSRIILEVKHKMEEGGIKIPASIQPQFSDLQQKAEQTVSDSKKQK